MTMLHHLHHAAAQDRLLAEARRVLLPGGVLCGSDNLGQRGSGFRLIHLGDTGQLSTRRRCPPVTEAPGSIVSMLGLVRAWPFTNTPARLSDRLTARVERRVVPCSLLR